MKIDIEGEYERFISNYRFNARITWETDKPHLARWAYGACNEWIRDFAEIITKEKLWVHWTIIEDKRTHLNELKQQIRTKFPDNIPVQELLK